MFRTWKFALATLVALPLTTGPSRADEPDDIQQLQRQIQEQLMQQLQQMQQQGGFGGLRFQPFDGQLPGGRPGRLGVHVGPVSETLRQQLDLEGKGGLVVLDVVPDSPAAKVGLKPHDILLQIDTRSVGTAPQMLLDILKEVKAGEEVEVQIVRKGKIETLKGLKLPEIKADAEVPPPAFPLVRPFPKLLQGQNNPYALTNPNSESNSVQIVNGDFTMTHKSGGLSITVKGKKAEGKLDVASIEVVDGGTMHKADKIADLPEKYRPQVEKMLDGLK